MADTNQKILIDLSVIDNFNESEKKIKSYTSSVKSLKDENAKLKEQRREVAAQLKANLITEAQAEAKLSELTKKIGENTQQIKQRKTEIASEKKAQEGYLASISSLLDTQNELIKTSASLGETLAKLKDSLSDMKDMSLDGFSPEEIASINAEMETLSTAIAVVKEKMNGIGNLQQLKDVETTLGAAAAATTVFSETLGLVGVESETLNQVQQTIGKLVTITQSLATISAFLNTVKVKSLLTTKQQSAANIAQAATTAGVTVATGAWAVAQKVLNAAMNAFPLFAIIGGVTALIGGIKSLVSWLWGESDASKAAAKAMENYKSVAEDSAKKVEQANANEKSSIERLNLAHRERILQMKKDGKSVEEIAAEEARHHQRLATEAVKASHARSSASRDEMNALNAAIKAQKVLAADGDKEAKARVEELLTRQRELNATLEKESNIRKDIALKLQEEAQARKEQAEADKKSAGKKYMNDALKEIEEQKKLRQEKLKAEDDYLSEEFDTRQSYAKREFDLEQQAAIESLELKRKFGDITQKEYDRQSEILLARQQAFNNQQKKQQEDHEAEQEAARKAKEAEDQKAQEVAAAEALATQQRHQKEIMKMLKQEAELQRQETKQAYEALIAELNAEMEKLPDKASEEYAEMAENIKALKLQLVADLAEIDKVAEKQRLEDLMTEIDKNALKELANADLTAKEKYNIERDALLKKMALFDKESEEFAALNQDLTKLDEEFQEGRLERAMEYVELAQEAMGALFEFSNAQDEAKLQKATEQNEQEKQQLKAQLDANLISKDEYNKKVKESDDKLAKEQAKVKRKQAIQEKISALFSAGINTAMSIVASAKSGFPAAIPFVAMSAALGAIQTAAIMAAPLPKAARGMYIKGASHARGGVQLEAEGGEMVINKKSSSMFAPLLSAINEAGGGVPFVSTSSDGGFAMREYRRNDTQSVTSDAIAAAVKDAVQEVKIYTAIEDINEGNRKYTALTDSSKF